VLTVAASFSSTAAMISSTAHGFLFNLHQQRQAGNDLLSFPIINSSRLPLHQQQQATSLSSSAFIINDSSSP
jgi:hypothetical protein